MLRTEAEDVAVLRTAFDIEGGIRIANVSNDKLLHCDVRTDGQKY